jgi:hypothetical protein
LNGILPNPEFVFSDILEVELVEMREPAVLAPDGKMPASYDHIVGTIDMAVSAPGLFKKVPHIVTTDPGECPGLRNIFNAGNKNTGSTAVITGNLSFVGYCFDYLICNLPAMVAVSAKFCENELVAHEKYWICPGSLICCILPSNLIVTIRTTRYTDKENQNINDLKRGEGEFFMILTLGFLIIF